MSWLGVHLIVSDCAVWWRDR